LLRQKVRSRPRRASGGSSVLPGERYATVLQQRSGRRRMDGGGGEAISADFTGSEILDIIRDKRYIS
jgi:hypothetical protein